MTARQVWLWLRREDVVQWLERHDVRTRLAYEVKRHRWLTLAALLCLGSAWAGGEAVERVPHSVLASLGLIPQVDPWQQMERFDPNLGRAYALAPVIDLNGRE